MKTRILSILLAIMMALSIFALSACDLGAIAGPEGPQGEQGEPGKDGQDGVGIRGITLVKSTGLVDTYLITYTNGATSTFTVTNGEDGKNGQDGVNGAPGQDGEDGKDGKDGVGIASVEINADDELVLIFTNGTSLNLGKVVGSDGKDGADGEDGKDGVDGAPGQDGADGKDGKDGIGIAGVEIVDGKLVITLSNGSTIDLGNIKGEDGKDGVDGEDGKDGVDGKPGQDGADGKDGINGKDGISIVKSEINANGELVLTYSDGTSINLGRVVGTDGKDGADGEDGKDGVDGKPGQDGEDGKDGADGKDGVDGIGISSVVINEKHELVVTLTNGTVINLGNIKGDKGDNGQDGVSIVKSEINANGELVLTYSNGVTVNLGKVVGADGKDGIDGEDGTPGQDGAPGEDGKDGVGIEKIEFDENGDLLITFTDGRTETVKMPEKAEHVHTYGAWHLYGEDTRNCENNIYYTVCSECNHVELTKGDSERHVWRTVYSSDASYHWYQCANCDAVKDRVAHEYDNACDTDCNICGADRTAYAHVYDRDICDVDCNVCGAVRTNPHLWDNACDGECDRCGETRDVPDHVYNNACDADCNVCGGTRVPADHVYDDEFDAVCNVCGERRDVPYTWGLEYALTPDEDAYMVIGIGEAKDTVITIPETHNGLPVTMIRARAFYDCNSITSVIIPESVTAIGGYAFADCDGLREIVIPDSVTLLGEYAFSSCLKLESVVIGDGVEAIGNDAFSHCYQLESVVIGDGVEAIGGEAFYNCSNLESVVIGNSVKTIGIYAFYNCSKLESIMIPDSVTSIGQDAFSKCSALKEVTIGEGVTSINSYAFDGCTALLNFTVSEDNQTYKSMDGNLYSKDGKTLVRYAIAKKSASFTVPESVEVIYDRAFRDSANLVRIIIQGNLKTVNYAAFYNCYSLMDVCYTGSEDEWKKVTIGDSNQPLTNARFNYNWCIHEYSGDCDAECDKCGEERVTHVEHTEEIIPAVDPTCTETGLTEGSHCSVCGHVFVEQEPIDVIDHNYVDGTCTMCEKKYFSEGLMYELNDDGESYTVLGLGECTDTDIIIPATYEGKPVTIIGHQAFRSENLTSVIMPDSITTIKSMAFMWCTSLTHITISRNVTVIEQGALAGCTSLTSFYVDEENTAFKTIDGNVYTIDGKTLVAYALAKPETEFIVPDGVEVIDRTAFGASTTLQSIILPKSLTAIGQSAFYGNENLKSIIIPIGVTEMEGAFYGCTDLTIYCEIGSQPDGWQSDWNNSNCVYYYSETQPTTEGYFWHYVNGVPVIWEAHIHIEEIIPAVEATCTTTGLTEGKKCSDCGEVLVAQEVVDALGHDYSKVGSVCSWCGELMASTGLEFSSNGDGTCYIKGYGTCQDSYVVIPKYSPDGEKVVSIGDRAFAEEWSYDNRKHKLSKIHIPDTVMYIGNSAFFACWNLTQIIIPGSVEIIEDYAFQWCIDLEEVTLTEGLLEIGTGAFENSRIKQMTIPASVTEIGKGAFYYCTQLAEIIVDSNNVHYASADGVLYNKDLTELIQYATPYFESNFIIPDGVERIADSAFARCDKLSSVVISNSITCIGNNAFYACSNLKSIEIPGSVSEIGDSAFESCYKLMCVTIDDGVEMIGSNAFKYDERILNIVIPSSVKYIGDGVFASCTQLSSIEVDYGNENYASLDGNLYDKNFTRLIQYPAGKVDTEFTVPDGVLEIHNSAFMGCSNINNVKLPYGLYVIGCDAFSSCSVLTTINIPETVERIDSYAFYGCPNLTIVCNMADQPTGWSLYWNPDSCNVIWTQGASLGLEYISNGDGTCYVNGIGECSDATIIIPSVSPAGERVIAIGESAFEDCYSIESVFIAEGVEFINSSAFSHCSNLKYISLPDSIKTIWVYAFAVCDNLEKINIGRNVSEIHSSAFWSNYSLSSITVDVDNEYYMSLDENLYTKDGTVIVKYAIGKTDDSFIIPEDVTIIGEDAFGGAHNLISIEMSNSITKICNSAFSNCTNLKELILGNSVEIIESNAFDFCSNLETITIPDSVTSIGSNAFQACNSLTDIYYTGTEEEWAKISIGSNNAYLTNATIHYNYVPEE